MTIETLTPTQRRQTNLAIETIAQHMQGAPSIEAFTLTSGPEGDGVRIAMTTWHGPHTLMSRALISPSDRALDIFVKATDMAAALIRSRDQ